MARITTARTRASPRLAALMLAAVALSGAALAGAPGVAATRVCPEGVPVETPRTPNDAVNSIIGAQVGEGSAVRACYDPPTGGCSILVTMSACVSEQEATGGKGACDGHAQAARTTEVRVTPRPVGPVAPYYSQHTTSACDSDSGGARLDASMDLFPALVLQAYWIHVGTACHSEVVYVTPANGHTQFVPCPPAAKPPLLPALP